MRRTLQEMVAGTQLPTGTHSWAEVVAALWNRRSAVVPLPAAAGERSVQLDGCECGVFMRDQWCAHTQAVYQAARALEGCTEAAPPWDWEEALLMGWEERVIAEIPQGEEDL